VAGYQLCDIPGWFVVDGVAQAMRLPGQPNGLIGHLTAYSGHDYEGSVGLLTNWQLRVATLAMDVWAATK